MNAVSRESVEYDPFAGASLARVIPTSEVQREVWLADKLSPQASLAFNESVSLRLHGVLDSKALIGALNALLQRHDALRCTFSHDGTEQFVGTELALDVPVFDLSALGASDVAAALGRAAAHAVEARFDLERGPLWRAALYRLGHDEHVLLMTAHHIVCDGWSWGLIAVDLGSLYAEQLGLAPGPDDAPSYADYVAWEAGEAGGAAMAEHERYWLARFKGSSLPVLDLPIDRQRPAIRGFNSRRIDHLLDAALFADVRQVGARFGASAFATLFTGFAVLLHRLTGQDDLVIGVPSAGQAASELTGLVGHCVNLLPIRTSVDATQTFEVLARRTSSELLDAFEHQTLTYGTLLRKLPAARDPRRLPLVSVMFNLDQEVKGIQDSFPGLRAQLNANPRHYENFELFVNAVPVAGGVRLECQFNTDLFDAETVQRWLLGYESLLRSVVLKTDQAVAGLPWLAPSALAELQALQPPPTPLAAAELMHSAFVRQSAATPDRFALDDGLSRLSYRELDQRSNRLARAMRARGVRRGERVGLCLGRGNDMVMALLAVLKAGGTYIPLDPGFPKARLAYYAEDAALALLLLDASAADAAPIAWCADAAQRLLRIDSDTDWQQHSAEPLPAGDTDALPETAAYIIYTSGSTGKPKGVCVPHRAVANFLTSMAREPGLGADDRLAAVTTLSFDIAVLELMLPLTVGGQVVIVPRDVAVDGNRLAALLGSSGATAMQATPSLWRMLLDTPWNGGRRFKALVGGEPCPAELAHQLLGRAGELWNMYGPTETTIWSTLWHVDGDVLSKQGMAIGRPIANTSVWILDDRLQPCPIGVPGEICIGGAGVALGYLDRPELTADRFVPDRFALADGSLLYRTGDRGRWLNSGLLEHRGRLDFQVKVRGYRIELGEIETLCSEFLQGGQTVVLAREDREGDVRLVAYLCPSSDAAIDEAALRAFLRTKLPDYMLPQHILVLDAIPLLPNGKIDRKALPAPDQSRSAASGERVAPRNDLERSVMTAMEAVLNLPGLSVHDDFFALGGHSLLAARLTSHLNRDFELNLPLSTLFEAPTAERLALAVSEARSSGLPKRQPIVPLPGRRSAPLTLMQDRIRFVEELHPGRLLYNTPSAHRLTGTMDRPKFERALREIVRRQPSLRTSVGADGGGHVQRIAESLEFDLPYHDLTPIPAAEREAELMRRMQQIVDTPMDIRRPPLFRVALYRLAEDQHAFLFMPHHLIWDGWSFDLFYEEMSAIYSALVEGRPNPLPALPISYGDYAQWVAEWMQGAEFDSQLRYWKQRFANAPMPAAPRLDKPRRAGMTGEGATEWVRIDNDLTERLRKVARTADATLNMLTLAVYAAMMTSVVEAESIVVGVPVRGRLMADAEPVMGFFNNLLPVQLRVDSQLPALDYIKTVRRELMDVLARQDVPFERLAAEPEVASFSQRVGLYQALFSFQDARDRKRQWGGLRHQSILIFQKGATEDLGLWLMEGPTGLEGGFTYNADIYVPETARAFRARYLELLNRLADDPSLRLAQLLSPAGSDAARYLVERGLPSAPDDAAATAFAPTVTGGGISMSKTEVPAPPAPLAAVIAEVTATAPLADPSLSPTEVEMSQVWKDLMRLSDVKVTDNFFDIGGYSLLAMNLISRIEVRFGKKISPATLLEAPTIRQLSIVLDQLAGRNSLVRLRAGAGRPPVFLIHDADGEILLYRNLAVRLHPDHPVYGIQPHAQDGYAMSFTRMSDIVAHYVAKIRSVQAHGPYLIGGLCTGGMIAFEIARTLQAEGDQVAAVALIDAADVAAQKRIGLETKRRLVRLREVLGKKRSSSALLTGNGPLAALAKKIIRGTSYELGSVIGKIELWFKVKLLQRALDKNSTPSKFVRNLSVREILAEAESGLKDTGKLRGNVILFRATKILGDISDEPFVDRYQDAMLGWGRRVDGAVMAIDIPAGHSTMLQEPHVAMIASKLQEKIDAAL